MLSSHSLVDLLYLLQNLFALLSRCLPKQSDLKPSEIVLTLLFNISNTQDFNLSNTLIGFFKLLYPSES